jgi:hypothetical protein
MLFLPMEEAVRGAELNYVWGTEDAQRAYVQHIEDLQRDRANEMASLLGHEWSTVLQRFPMPPRKTH